MATLSILLFLAVLAVPAAPIALPLQAKSNIHLATPTVRPFLPDVILDVEDAAVQVVFDTQPTARIIYAPPDDAKATEVAEGLWIFEVEPVVYGLDFSLCYYARLIWELARLEVFVIAAFVLLLVILVENYVKTSFLFHGYTVRTFE